MGNKIDRKKLNQLATALAVIQTDFEPVTAKERPEILTKAGVFDFRYESAGRFSQELLDEYGSTLEKAAKQSKDYWKLLVEHMKILKPFFEWFYDEYKEGIRLEFYKGLVLSKAKKGIYELHDLKRLRDDNWVIAQAIIQRGWLHPEGYKRELVKEFSLPGEFVKLMNLLDGIPVNRIKRCENDKCRKIFVQLTERSKIYCDKRCQNTVAVRELRKRQKK